MSKIRHIIIEDHAIDCAAVEMFSKGEWETPWAYFNGKAHYGTNHSPFDKRSNKIRWIEVLCNSSSCTGKIAVNELDIFKALK